MEFKTDALLLRAVDYGENDKMATLLTADRGKLGAALKGVKKAGAKLRFAAQPFCFAEYVLAEKNGRHTVISASLHDGFFSLCEDIGTFYAACTVTETCDKLLYEGMPSGELLVAAVGALREMCRGEPAHALIVFLLAALRLAGYPVLAALPPFGDRLFFDMERGAFSLERGTPASAVTYFAIRRALGSEAPPCTGDGEKRALKLLYSYFAYQTDSELVALFEYIKLL